MSFNLKKGNYLINISGNSTAKQDGVYNTLITLCEKSQQNSRLKLNGTIVNFNNEIMDNPNNNQNNFKFFIFIVYLLIMTLLGYKYFRIHSLLKLNFKLLFVIALTQSIQYFLGIYNIFKEYEYLKIDCILNILAILILIILLENLLHFNEIFEFNLIRKKKLKSFLILCFLFFIIIFLYSDNKNQNTTKNLTLFLMNTFIWLFYYLYFNGSLKELLNLLIISNDIEPNSEVIVKIYNNNIKPFELFDVYRYFQNLTFGIFSLLAINTVLNISIQINNTETYSTQVIKDIYEYCKNIIFFIFMLGLVYFFTNFSYHLSNNNSIIMEEDNLDNISNDSLENENIY